MSDAVADSIEKKSKRGRPRGKGTQVVYDALREEILTLAARPGEHLDESRLEKRFSVSRTPIREALIRLQAERLVRFSANRGHFVEAIDLDEIPRIFEALDLLQGSVFRLAAYRRTDRDLADLREINEEYRASAVDGDFRGMTEKNHEFHIRIGRAADNTLLSEAFVNVMNSSLRLTYMLFETASRSNGRPREYYDRIYGEHDEMVDMLRRRDADALDEISRRHVKLFSGRVAEYVDRRRRLRTEPQSFDTMLDPPTN